MSTFWVYVLICVSGPGCTPGDTIAAAKAGSDDTWALTRTQCERYAHDIAVAMFADGHGKYGFKCSVVDYDPPNLDLPK